MKQPTDAVPPDISLVRGERELTVAIPGPIDYEGFPSQISHVYELPETAVIALIAVVSHHEEAVWRNLEWPHIVSLAGNRRQNSGVAVNRIGFRKRLIIDKHLLVLNPYRIPGQADYPLNEVFGRVDGIAEYDNILALGFTDVQKFFIPVRESDPVDKLVDQEVVTNEQRRLHGAGWNLECLNNKRTDHQGQEKSNDNGFGVITDGTF